MVIQIDNSLFELLSAMAVGFAVPAVKFFGLWWLVDKVIQVVLGAATTGKLRL